MQNPSSTRLQPAIILGLVALVLVLFWLLVAARINNTGYGNNASLSGSTPESIQSEQRFHWKLVTTWPKNFPGLGSAATNFSRLVEEMSEGRLTVSVYGAGELVPALGVFDAVSSGSVEAGHGAAYYWKGKNTATQFFTSVPFGMNAQEMNGWLYYGGGMELWREVYAPFNIVPFAAGNTGIQMAGWFNREINSMEDIKGLKMRIPGLGGEVWNRAGGSSINIPGGELYTALQTGVIDATEWVGPYNDLAFGFYQVAKYYYYPGWHETGSTLELIVNKDALEALPKDLQVIVETAARMSNQDMLDEFTGRNNTALQELIHKHKVDVRPIPKPVLDELRTIAHQIYQEEADKNPDFKRVYDAYRNFQQGVETYHKVSEQAYYEIRD
ncbi:TRAP transporter substrate-binding protein DctP [Pseudomaricurvus alkylphenolicus]|jgi:TRAP-type mannitol/chloroaromatic compound transport system substrate-binding protein|uniref:TRAP transporter substrate-binding protein n=1 Tax=Pseudomaricurvus alkylphenolicus TaxID=1306991 RepID=UPI00141DA1AF|nr:TRAP transporter substrate-binding protein DctP [Pseudomaricurvus alkylphenolicus]NIB39470.1 TRAP transporter substrate-binding protein DctP [Pseudomaricurvus alkylphenolicus]